MKAGFRKYAPVEGDIRSKDIAVRKAATRSSEQLMAATMRMFRNIAQRRRVSVEEAGLLVLYGQAAVERWKGG